MPRRGSIDWNAVLERARELAFDYMQLYDTPPTLRGLFYMLVSENALPNTKSAYKKLSEKLAKARYEGAFPWWLLKDETRAVYHLEPSEHYQTEPLTEERLRELVEEIIESRFDVQVNPWHDQIWRVIVVLEKQALADTVRNAIRQAFRFGVYQLRVIRGYDSATDIKKLAEEVSKLLLTHNVAILVLSDFDPSGEDIFRDFQQRVRMLVKQELRELDLDGDGVGELVFEKVAILAEQIVELNIPPAPESVEELQKLRRDPRYRGFMERIKRDPLLAELVERHGIVRAELDALVALHHDEFIRILREAITKYWDEEIYEKVTKPRLEKLKRQAEEAKRKSLEALGKVMKERAGEGTEGEGSE